MKTLLNKILVLAVMFGTYASYANDTLEVATTINYVKKGNRISVSDAKGEIIYSGKINFNGNLTSLFDFSQLNDGEYTIEVTKDFEIEIYTIAVKNHMVSYVKDSNKKVFKPVFRVEDDKILISKLAIDTDEMNVELYYEDDLIHSETVTGNEVLNRVYKLDKKLQGAYTAVIKFNDRVFVENFRI